MRKAMALALVAWVLLVVGGELGACESSDPGCSQGQTQGQLQGQAQGQGQLQGQTSTNLNSNQNNNLNSNVNVVKPNQTMYVDVNNKVTYTPTNVNLNNVNPSSVSGASATGGQGGAGGNASSNSSSSSNATSASSSSANGTNVLTVTSPENKRELPNIPSGPGVGQLEFRGPYGKGMYQFIAPWQTVSEWNPGMIEGFPSCYWNCDVEVAKVWRTIFERNWFKVVKKSDKKLIGWVIIRATNPLELWGKVAKYAFEWGAEEVVENAYQSTFSNKSGGWNVGFGGGATAVSNGNDNVGGSIGGGTGFGAVETRPVEKCQAAFTIYGK